MPATPPIGAELPPGPGLFDDLADSLDPALLIVTAAVGGERDGCLVSLHTQTSVDPPRYGVWLHRTSHTYSVAARASHLGLHFLNANDLDLARTFTTPSAERQKIAAIAQSGTGPAGVPILTSCQHRIVLRIGSSLDDGGSHVCLTGEPSAVEGRPPHRPLRLSHLDDTSSDTSTRPGSAAEPLGARSAELFQSLADTLMLAIDLPVDELRASTAFVEQRLRAYANTLNRAMPPQA